MKFEKRKEKLQEELVKVLKKYSIELYPENMVMQNGEVSPVIKMADTEVSGEVLEEDGDKTKG